MISAIKLRRDHVLLRHNATLVVHLKHARTLTSYVTAFI